MFVTITTLIRPQMVRYLFCQNGAFTFTHAKKVAKQANKALFSMLRKPKDLDLPDDLQTEVCNNNNHNNNKILLYGSEVSKSVASEIVI